MTAVKAGKVINRCESLNFPYTVTVDDRLCSCPDCLPPRSQTVENTVMSAGFYLYLTPYTQIPFPSPWLIPLPYSRNESSFRGPSGSLSFRLEHSDGCVDTEAMVSGAFPVYGLSSCSSLRATRGKIQTSLISSRASNSALSDLSNGNLQVINDLLEAKETAGLFKGSVNSIARSVMAFKRRNPRDWLRVRDQNRVRRENTDNLYGYPDSWLALQYGWKPTLSELQSGLDMLNNAPLEKLQIRVAAFGKSKEELSYPETRFLSFNGISGTAMPFGARVVDTVEEKVYAKVRLDYIQPYPSSRIYEQIGVVNLPGIIWEAVPYSFVVDQMLPIGNYLSGWTADWGLTFKSGTSSMTRRYVSPIGTSVDNRWINGLSPGYIKDLRFTRSVLTATPAPVFPKFRNPFSNIFNVANDLALLVNAFKR